MTPIIVSLVFWVSINSTAPVQQVIAWDGSLSSCESNAQIEMARWIGEHPAATVVGPYRCTAEPAPGDVA